MIIILKQNASPQKTDSLITWLESKNVSVHTVVGSQTTILGLIGDTLSLDMGAIRSNDIVEDVKRIQDPYKNANRKFHPDDTIIDVAGHKVGGKYFSVIAGPCSVETPEQITEVAKAVQASGAGFLRGGAFKPRTSPYSFQGLGADGIEMLSVAKEQTGLPLVSELMSLTHIDLFDNVDVIQVGARNMQNFEMLKELGKIRKPILLKRGLANTIEEFLMSAEYIMAGGNNQVILCERGIRTFETMTRNTLDISAVILLKKLSHLPVIVDPSHAAGINWMVKPLAMSAIAAGADGLMIEVHNCPEKALCDGAQSITPDVFNSVMGDVKRTTEFFGKTLN
ncbi:MAG: 3-deoxy-7-phosphoheptulonate synthase [Oscillospiraceae bacterium]